MPISSVFFVLLLVLFNALSANAATWQQTNGPGGGTVQAISSNNGVLVLYATGASNTPGGMFKSSDNGTSWTKVSGLPSNNINVLLGHNGTIYAGTQGSGLFKSADVGTTWTKVSGLTDVYVVSLFSVNGAIYAGTASGVYNSADNGTTWTVVKGL